MEIIELGHHRAHSAPYAEPLAVLSDRLEYDRLQKVAQVSVERQYRIEVRVAVEGVREERDALRAIGVSRSQIVNPLEHRHEPLGAIRIRYSFKCTINENISNHYFVEIIDALLWTAKSEYNQDEMKSRAILIGFRMCNFHYGKYFLKHDFRIRF